MKERNRKILWKTFIELSVCKRMKYNQIIGLGISPHARARGADDVVRAATSCFCDILFLRPLVFFLTFLQY